MVTVGVGEDASAPRSVADAVTERLRDEIVSARIRPGEHIRLRVLEELLGVSHIPIREALRRLEGEGLVENIPQRGAIATRVSAVEFAELFDLRALIEPPVAVRALRAFDSARFAEIRQELAAMRKVPPSDGAAQEYLVHHRRFHHLMLEPGWTPIIEQTLNQLWQLSDRYVSLSFTYGGGVAFAVREHRRLYSLARAGDAEALREGLVDHLIMTEHMMGRSFASVMSDEATDGFWIGTRRVR